MLVANGENVKVVQELMRHANCRCTLEIYSQARIQTKREAQHRVVQMILPQEQEVSRMVEVLVTAKAEVQCGAPGLQSAGLNARNPTLHPL